MQITEKLNSLNKSYSYILFALTGLLIVIFRIYCLSKGNYTYNYMIIDYLFFPACFLLIFILSLFENIFKFKIKKEKLFRNKALNIILSIGTIAGIIYVILILTFIFYGFVIIPLFH